MLEKKIIGKISVKPGERVRLKDFDTKWSLHDELKDNSHELEKKIAKSMLKESVENLARAQELLYANGTRGVLIVLQGMDTAGKDGIIKHVMSGINPQGCLVSSFKQPSQEELAHTFLWRYGKAIPARGYIGIFNRSYYEDVLVVKVHPELLGSERIDPKDANEKFWNNRYDDINAFERHLARNGILVLKFFLHISKKEQKDRLLARLENSEKLWKYSPGDLVERGFWTEYETVYEAALTATNSADAPWYIIPADYKWAARGLIADVITSEIRTLNLQEPAMDKKLMRQIQEARDELQGKDKDKEKDKDKGNDKK